MKLSFSRSSILTAIVVAVLLAALPGAIRRYLQTRDPYLFSQEFFEDMWARLSGPGRFRFILQPAVAVFLGTRDGKRDAQMGRPLFLSALAFQGSHWPVFLRSAFESTPPESTLPDGGTIVLYARARRVIESSRITTSRLCSTRRFAFSITISAT